MVRIFTKINQVYKLGFDTKKFLRGLSIDCVIFGFHDNELKVLLLETPNDHKWSLPGGYIRKEEDLDQAAYRMLRERTQLENVFLDQFSVFGKTDRKDDTYFNSLFLQGYVDEPTYQWISTRTVTVGYYALVDYSKVVTKPDEFALDCQWYSPQELPTLTFDHKEIIENALETLRLKLRFQPVGINLLPTKFTMPEFQALYETILGEKLDRRNFQRKMLSYGILKKLPERRKGGAHKAPYLYTFDIKGYNEALKIGLKSGW